MSDETENDLPEDDFGVLPDGEQIPDDLSGRLDEFTAIAAWVANRSDLDDEAKSKLDHMMTNNTKKLKLATHVLAMRRMHRLAKFLNVADNVEEMLFNEDRIANSGTGDLIKMLQIIQSEVKSSIDFIQSIAKEDTPGHESPHSILSSLANSEDALEKAGAMNNMSPRQRDELRKRLEKLSDIIKKKNKEDVSPE